MKNISRLLLIGCLTHFLSVASGSSETRPNVLFISVDDLNDWAGYRGHKQALTPNMDRLARSGVWFSNAYCQYPVCGPSRASVMSGLYFHQLEPDRLQVKDKFVEDKVESMGSRLLHGYFHDHGYKTMAVGKILHRHLPKKDLDLSGGRGGWDFHVDENGDRAKTYWKSQATMTDWGYSQIPEDQMSDSEAATWAVEQLQADHDQPFFLMAGFLRPHVPWYVPKSYYDKFDRDQIILPPYRSDDLDDVPQAGRDTLNEGYPRTEWAQESGQWQHMVQAYLASISLVDTKVGLLLDALEASPYHDNTIVVLWSDHGYHLGEKNTFQKHTLWERSAKAPLIIKLPAPMASIQDQGECARPVGLIDLYPTLVDLCGLPPNDKVAGRSLKPLLNDRAARWDYPALTYRKDGGRSVRDERYRYIEYGDGSAELYDHHQDPNEWENLARDSGHSQVLRSMKEKLMDFHVP